MCVCVSVCVCVCMCVCVCVCYGALTVVQLVNYNEFGVVTSEPHARTRRQHAHASIVVSPRVNPHVNATPGRGHKFVVSDITG